LLDVRARTHSSAENQRRAYETRKVGPFRRYYEMAELASQLTSPSLLLRIRDPGDSASWGTFVNLYAPLIYRYGRRHGLQDADAADMTQEVLTRVARAVRDFSYQPERGRFRDWLGLLTHRALLTSQKKAGRQEAGYGGPDGPADEAAALPADSTWTDEFNDHLLRAASERIRPAFETQTWDAFDLVWNHDRPAREVARELGVPVATVYVAKSRVLRRLRDEVLHLAEDVACLNR
jgi:RNA polymerase sigma-70 factor (ECF subfamily)